MVRSNTLTDGQLRCANQMVHQEHGAIKNHSRGSDMVSHAVQSQDTGPFISSKFFVNIK